MRITIVTVGSRGDVQPYVALGAGLQAAGHSVRLNTHTAYEPLARRHGLDFHKLEGDPRAILEAGRGRFNTLNPLTFWSRLLRAGAPIYRGMAQDVLEASRDADAILYSSLAYFAAYDVARKCGALPLAAYLQPVTPTHYFPMPSSPPLPRWLRFVRGPLNRLSFTVGEWLFWLVVRPAVNQMRREMLDLPPLPLRPPYVGAQTAARPVLYGYSPAVLPPPPDWPPHCHVTGYWLLGAEDWTPPEALSRFLEAGPPPVYIGFGSMNSNDAEKTTRIVLEALASAGQRAVLFTGWGALTSQRLPESVLAIDSTPHDWLFPRMAAVVHHGGGPAGRHPVDHHPLHGRSAVLGGARPGAGRRPGADPASAAHGRWPGSGCPLRDRGSGNARTGRCAGRAPSRGRWRREGRCPVRTLRARRLTRLAQGHVLSAGGG